MVPTHETFRAFLLIVNVIVLCVSFASAQQTAIEWAFKNPSLPVEQRVNDLVSRMTLEEKVSQIGHTADAVPRLGIPEYNWWNEGLHGVARAGYATVFPSSDRHGRDCSTNRLCTGSPSVISTEFRAKYYAESASRRLRHLVPRPHSLVAEHQYFSRSALGPRPGNLR